MAAFALLWVCALANVVAFFGLRLLVARGVGPKAFPLAIGRDHEPWASTRVSRRIIFAAVGPVGCYLCAAFFFALGASLDGTPIWSDDSTRITVVAGGPAARAGLEDGDIIRSVDDVPTRTFTELRAEVTKRPNAPMRLSIERGGSGRTLVATASADGKIGVLPVSEMRREPFGAAIAQGLAMPARIWIGLVKSLVLRPSSTVEMAGPVAIVRETEKASRSAWGWKFVAGLNAYFLWGPILFAAALFPRPSKRRPEPAAK